jgi:hypothetical protein
VSLQHIIFLKDPPFGKIDLVSCRNVLIYMEPYLQKKAMTTFHYVKSKRIFATRQIRNYRWCSRSFASIEKTINYIAVKMYQADLFRLATELNQI